MSKGFTYSSLRPNAERLRGISRVEIDAYGSRYPYRLSIADARLLAQDLASAVDLAELRNRDAQAARSPTPVPPAVTVTPVAAAHDPERGVDADPQVTDIGDAPTNGTATRKRPVPGTWNGGSSAEGH